MASALQHRGPDDQGVWSDPAVGLALGHRRLSIVDLSQQGHQPMQSSCGRLWIVYNGEIYNHAELRGELAGAGFHFRGSSDTEVLVEALARWGWSQTLRRLIGMFAFAVWDSSVRALTLVRDRLGIKPLYYGWCGDSLLFGSELKAFRQHPSFKAEIDRNAVALFVQHNYVPAPWSIYRGVYKLMPGSRVTFPVDAPRQATHETYWSAQEIAAGSRQRKFSGTVAEAAEELDRLIRDATRLRMRADVPLGAFLSGGVDSSTVVAAMQAQSQRPIHTFCIGFQEPSYNEAPHAAKIAEHLGTDHVEWYVSPREAQAIIPTLPHIFDEPFADSSQIPTCLVSQLARKHVIVSLSGDGGDELFGGYTRYATVSRFAGFLRRLPVAVRPALASVLRRVPVNRVRVLGRLLRTGDFQELYRLLNRHWDDPEQLVIGAHAVPSIFDAHGGLSISENLLERMMILDTVTYLPDDILTKVDRCSMAYGLEARVPLLDHRLFEFAWSLPAEWKAGDGGGAGARESLGEFQDGSKRILRRVLGGYVPRELFERPKVGFGVPIDEWLRGPLREWAEDLLSKERLDRDGFFNSRWIRRLWQRHVENRANWHYWLWDILMFQSWLEHA